MTQQHQVQTILNQLSQTGINPDGIAFLQQAFHDLNQENTQLRQQLKQKQEKTSRRKTATMVYENEYTREHPVVEYQYTCQICQTAHTVILPAGGATSKRFRPRYCLPADDEKTQPLPT